MLYGRPRMEAWFPGSFRLRIPPAPHFFGEVHAKTIHLSEETTNVTSTINNHEEQRTSVCEEETLKASR